MAHDCFISYARADQELARQLIELLQAEGIAAWWDPVLKDSAGPWPAAVAEAIHTSRAFVVLVTENSARSTEVLNEVQLAEADGKAVIPLFVGRPPTTGGVLHRVISLQRVATKTNSIQREKALELARMIPSAPPVDRTPAIKLEKIPLNYSDVPKFGNLETAIHEACQAYFTDAVIKGNLTEAEKILSDMKNWSIPVTPVEQFEAAESWIQWLNWYDTYARQASTWGELAKDLQRRARLQSESPEAFSRLCAPVAKQLNSAWQGLVLSWCQRFLDAIVRGSWDMAIRELETFHPDWLRPFDNLIVGIKNLSESPEGTFQSCGAPVVAWYRSRERL